jgi:hypothetical protein
MRRYTRTMPTIKPTPPDPTLFAYIYLRILRAKTNLELAELAIPGSQDRKLRLLTVLQGLEGTVQAVRELAANSDITPPTKEGHA